MAFIQHPDEAVFAAWGYLWGVFAVLSIEFAMFFIGYLDICLLI